MLRINPPFKFARMIAFTLIFFLLSGLVPACSAARGDDFRVERGQLTFDAEGTEGGTYHSRRAHVPTSTSGVTIGRGYDLKERTRQQVINDLTRAGLHPDEAAKFGNGVGLSGERAKEFVKNQALPEISPSSQKKLFEISYEAAASDVHRICGKADVVQRYGATNWDRLHPAIRDLLVDLRFRGDYTPGVRERIQTYVVKNNLEKLKDDLSDREQWKAVPTDRFNRRKAFAEAACTKINGKD